MNATSRAMPGPHANTPTVAAAAAQLDAVQDALSRVQRALDALQDGEREFAEAILDDLIGDLWTVLEQESTR